MWRIWPRRKVSREAGARSWKREVSTCRLSKWSTRLQRHIVDRMRSRECSGRDSGGPGVLLDELLDRLLDDIEQHVEHLRSGLEGAVVSFLYREPLNDAMSARTAFGARTAAHRVADQNASKMAMELMESTRKSGGGSSKLASKMPVVHQ